MQGVEMKLVSRLAAACAILIAVLGWMPAAPAATVFQSIPDLTVNPQQNALCSSCGSHLQVWDKFTLSSAATIEHVSLAVGTLQIPSPEFIKLTLWTVSSGGFPGDKFFEQAYLPADYTSSVPTAFNTSIISFDPTGLSLLAGNYYVSFIATNLHVPTYLGGSGGIFASAVIGGFIPGQSLGFRFADDTLAVATPVPAALPLYATGLSILGVLAWRRKRRAVSAEGA
jgi:hypothetical protein